MSLRILFFLFTALFTSFTFLLNINVGYAIENSDTELFNAETGYYLLQYNGDVQTVSINEYVTLRLTGWSDDAKVSVNAKIEMNSDPNSQAKSVVLNINEGLSELAITDNEQIYYRVIVAETFNADIVKSLSLNEQVTVVEKNENGTFVKETKLLDEYGTVIENKGFTYYSNQNVVITEVEYRSLNTDASNSETNKNDPLNIKDELNNNEETSRPVKKKAPSIVYSTHIQDYGWLNTVSDGQLSGTFGQLKRMEAIKISLENTPYTGGVSYKTHVQTYGWLTNVSEGGISGTSGERKRLEAIQISLTGEMANHYDVYYRVHAQSYGWLNWAKNGQSAGTQGLAKRLEAIEIVLVEKGGNAPGSTNQPLVMDPAIEYSTHVQTYGWLATVTNGNLSGTEGQAKRMEAVKVTLKNAPYPGGISYRTHVQTYGWLNPVSNGASSGTSGERKRLEAIEISLTGEMANYYDVYYRVHAQTYGWLDWAKNGESAGTERLAKRLEAIEIVLVEKGGAAPGTTTKPFVQPGVIVSNNYYNLTLTDALTKQMALINPPPQTDKYRNNSAYINSQYLTVFDGGLITGSNVNLRTSPDLAPNNIATNVGLGASFKVLESNVTGENVSGNTKWYKIDYSGQILYVHSNFANINKRIGQVTAATVNILADKTTVSHIYGTANKGTQFIVLEEDNSGWYRLSIGDWRHAMASDVKQYLNPIPFVNDEKQRLQFMDLTRLTDITVTTLNQYLAGKGILANQGKAFIDAGKKYGINEVYLTAHTLLETGHGTSTLAKGVLYNGKTVYNMYGVGAFDHCPTECGAQRAYEEGWFTPYDAIVGGAAYISDRYLGGNNPYTVVQNTLYEMRWNPEVMATKGFAGNQYASDIGWAYKQVNAMYDIYKLQQYTIYLEVPVYN